MICYSHSSYFAEVPSKYLKDTQDNIIKDEAGNPKENSYYKDYIKTWGIANPESENKSLPKLVKPTKFLDEDLYNEKPF